MINDKLNIKSHKNKRYNNKNKTKTYLFFRIRNYKNFRKADKLTTTYIFFNVRCCPTILVQK